MNSNKEKRLHRIFRHRRVRARIFGTPEIPRLSVFRSNRHIFAQLIDDESGKTLISISDIKSKEKSKKKDLAFNLGKDLAKVAQEKKIKTVVFDRGGYKYHGRVKAFAQGAREGGLKF